MSNVVPLRGGHVDLGRLYVDGLGLYRSGRSPRGQLTGWPSLDDFYSIEQGQWTVVTGIPQSGKSEWLDALLVNLAEREKWMFAIYSPENWPPVEHLIKMVEKRVRKPFYVGQTPRMTEQEYANGAAWVLEHFTWLDIELKAPELLIEAALSYEWLDRKVGVVLDPWNTLDHQRAGMNETDYVSLILTEVTKLARTANAHVWLVVHPTKIYKDKSTGLRPVPTPYDISGSAHWYNKADNIITIHRDQGSATQDVEVHVQKVRFKRVGRIGLATLKYDRVVGRYFDMSGSGVPGETYADPERGASPPGLDLERVAIQQEGL